MESIWLIFQFTDTGETEKIFLRGNNDLVLNQLVSGKIATIFSFLFYVHCNTSYKNGYLPNFLSLAEIISIVYRFSKKSEERKHKRKGMKI